MNNKLLWALDLVLITLSTVTVAAGLVLVLGMMINPPIWNPANQIVFWSSVIVVISVLSVVWPLVTKYLIVLFSLIRALIKAREVNKTGRPGHIYILKRSDGVYKIGRTINIDRRIKQHESDYRQGFKLIMRFVVPDVEAYEALALDMSKEFKFSEPGRKELRNMSDYQLYKFTKLFGYICAFSAIKGNWTYVFPGK